jgi:serine protease Do
MKISIYKAWYLYAVLFLGIVIGVLAARYVDSIRPVARGEEFEKQKKQVEDGRKWLQEHAAAIESLNVFSAVAKVIAPSVVSISSVRATGIADEDERYWRLWSQPAEMEVGSGVIISAEGHILTNSHVAKAAAQARRQIKVKLEDGREFVAAISGVDSESDIAVLKIDAKDLLPAEFGDSDALSVGDWVMAVGNPFGLHHTFSTGIVSAVGRSGLGVASYEGFIQTDAAINPGNSGGPMVNLYGQVVGINTAILSRSGGNQGIGFAIPVNRARLVMDGIMKQGKFVRGYLGVKASDINGNIAEAYGFASVGDLLRALKIEKPDGAFIFEAPGLGSPAEKGGLREGDVVIKYGDKAPGSSVNMLVMRDGKQKELTVLVGSR